MDETNSNMLHYGFSSLDEEIAKDQMDAEHEFRPDPSASLENNSNASTGALQNVNPSSVLNITGQPVTDTVTPGATTMVSATLVPVATSGNMLATVEMAPKPPTTSKPRKRKSNKGPKDENAPKLPQTGYVMYMNERRDAIKLENPTITFPQLTKKIASEWSSMDTTTKQKYLDVAEENKARYMEELAAYQQTDAYKRFQKLKQQQEVGGGSGAPTPTATTAPEPVSTTQRRDTQSRLPGLDVPIFTEEFLDHNKAREKELRELRKLNTQYEEQNAILSKHVEQLKAVGTQLEEEAELQRNNNIALLQHLQSLRSTLTTNFSSIPLPGTAELPTEDTVDSYMTRLHQLILESPQEHGNLIVAVREVVNKLNLDAYVT